MEPPGVKFPFGFCALRYLLQWQQREEDLHRRISSRTPTIDDLRRALRYFQVARNFKGLKDDQRASLVLNALLAIRARGDTPPERKVALLAESFKAANFQRNTSAASKLLWLSSRRPFILYDSRALTALVGEYGHKGDKSDYAAYCSSWRKAYTRHTESIRHAVNELPKARAFLPGSTPPDGQLLALVNRPWFRERVFDIYLWELGGDG